MIIWMATGILVLLTAFLVWASSSICSGVYLKALCRHPERSSWKVAITFDDGPHAQNTPLILEVLERHAAEASFFLIGKHIAGKEELVGEIHGRGHSLGNHGFSHSNRFPLFRGWRIAGEIRACSDMIEGICGEAPRYFRPPFGVSNPRVARGHRESGLQVIGWSIRSMDTRGGAPGSVAARVIRKMKGGDIILLHDTTPGIEIILEEILSYCEQQGYACVNLEKFLNHEK